MKPLDVRGVRKGLALALGCAMLATACGGKGARPQDGGGGGASGDGSSSNPDVSGDGSTASDVANPGTDGPGTTDARPGDAPADQIGGNTGGRTGGGGNGGNTGVGGNTGNGGSAGDAGSADRPPDVGGCPVDCSHLPHVLAGAAVACVNGECVIPFGVCEANYAHCRGSGNGGCETSLTTASDCGYCNYSCFGSQYECRNIQGSYRCAQICAAPMADSCDFLCTDFKTDNNNCGSCGHQCSQWNAVSTCVAGQCSMSTCVDGYADCGGVNDGCETTLGTTTDCGACGDKPCVVANTMFTCHDGATTCNAGLCATGFANCDVSNPDCEAPFTMTASCLPNYIDTQPIASGVQDFAGTAIAADGSVYVAGMWMGAVDFDPTAGKDIRMATDEDSFVTKFNPDGSYGWTASFGGRGTSTINSVAITPTGAVVVTGSYNDTIILDASGGTAPLQTATAGQTDPYFAELTTAGKLAWGGSFRGQGVYGYGASFNFKVATDAAGAVFLAGTYNGTLDFDPGPGTTMHAVTSDSGVVVKLSAAGALLSARYYDNAGCTASLTSVTVASDGSVWAVGSATTGTMCPLDPRVAPLGGGSLLIVKHDASNAPLGKWLIGPSANVSGNTIAPAAAGAVIVGGSIGAVDFDPGPGVVRHWTGMNGGGFILKLDANAGFRWVRTVVDGWIDTMAPTPDGGVIALGGNGYSNLVTRVNGDGGAIWTFKAGGGSTTPTSVASSATRFAIAGNSSGNVDMNPGPALDLLFGDITFVSRYSF